jgi:hypothetical protein
MSSALELHRVSDVLKERVARGHLAGETGLLKLLSELKKPASFNPEVDIPLITAQMAEQATVSLEAIVSAATVVLSHSTADDVFTAACELSMELAPKDWISELNPKRNVPLKGLIENGCDAVIADELESLRGRIGGKSLPSRAEMLFRHVQVEQHPLIPSEDPQYFRMSALRDADALRNSIVHGDGLPRIERIRSTNVMLFLHEAAFVAIRSIVTAYRIPKVWGHLMKLIAPKP